jgi:hypothetical protein
LLAHFVLYIVAVDKAEAKKVELQAAVDKAERKNVKLQAAADKADAKRVQVGSIRVDDQAASEVKLIQCPTPTYLKYLVQRKTIRRLVRAEFG